MSKTVDNIMEEISPPVFIYSITVEDDQAQKQMEQRIKNMTQQ